jgi:hypothetical protein
MRTLHAQLSRGRLEVTAQHSDLPPEALFGFAERRNPKRAFLFVSRVLGRHIPVRPSVMRDSVNRLAAKIPDDLPGPVLVIGMAETAVGLGAGVHDALSRQRDDTVFLVSTRHPVFGGELFTIFEEEHSHASSHLIYQPQDPEALRRMREARSLVLVDDEASTGKTFINLYRALRLAGLTGIERVVTATLTDWSANAVADAVGPEASSVALLEGGYAFHERADAPLPEMPTVDTVANGAWALHADVDWGRLGVMSHLDTLATDFSPGIGERILVVGTGEFVWRPFLLAERLERAGADVHFGSTTRSPIALGHAIERAHAFSDNYGLGIPNFLYNVDPSQYDRILLCSETPAAAVDASLVEALGADIITDLGDAPRTTTITGGLTS